MAKNSGGIIVRRVLVKNGKTWLQRTVNMSGFAGDTAAAVDLMTKSLNHQYGERGWKWNKTTI